MVVVMFDIQSYIMYLQEGERLISRKEVPWFLNVDQMRDIEWFRLESFDDETGYGVYKGTYVLNDRLTLLNLGNRDHRELILKNTDLTKDDLNPDMQYSGYRENLKVHRAIMKSDTLLRSFDGTIFVEKFVELDLKEILGDTAEEVVLFMDRIGSRISLVKVEKLFVFQINNGRSQQA
jgi:hypothetical protein